jgi:YidC/Oxa1 family membrane protein insertase
MLTINGKADELTQWRWELVKAEPGEVILQTEPDALDAKTGKPHTIARTQKIFTLAPNSYDVHINHKIENLTDEPLTVSIDQFGPFNIPLDSNRGEDRSYQLAAYNSEKKYVKTDAKAVSQMSLKKNNVYRSETLGDFSAETDPALWVAASNRFFTVIVRPEGGPAFDVDGGRRQVTIPRFAAQTSVGPVAPGSENIGILMKGNTVSVPAKATSDLSLDVFMGPKQRQLLAGDLNARIGSAAWL